MTSHTRRRLPFGARIAALLIFVLAAPSAVAAAANHPKSSKVAAAHHPKSHKLDKDKSYTLDKELTRRASRLDPRGTTRVIVTLQPGATLPTEFKRYARAGKLEILNAHVVDLPNVRLKQLSANPAVLRVHHDRPTFGENYRTAITTGARAVQQIAGLTGAGVGVAVIDSGIATWHDDLTSNSSATYPYGNQRVAAFVDLVNGLAAPYDDNGHGSHVAGIIAGNGTDSAGLKAGIAPDASIVSLKVLGADGRGTISNIIGALDWVLANHAAYNIRVVNMSVGAGIHESYLTDPLTLAAKRVVDAGVLVVVSAGIWGKNAAGQTQYGGVSSPGNAPWVLTVGASSSNGTPTRTDDTIAGYSSRGPTYIDYAAKPDLVAPGSGSVSLAVPGSTMYTTKAQYLLPGTIATPFLPYLSLSGTSMAAPVVAGTAALMLQANPTLTPNAIKAILQYTSQTYDGYNALTQGAGFLNTVGAVRLARFFATAQPGAHVPVQQIWSKHILWGNHMLSGGLILPAANAWGVGVTWGAAKTPTGLNIVWGEACPPDTTSETCDNIVWGENGDDNIAWGNRAADDDDNIVWGEACEQAEGCDDDNIVWGEDCQGDDCDNIVWGEACDPAVQTCDDDNIVWGEADDDDNIVWGETCDPAVQNCDDDNIVWGEADDDDNIVWGEADDDNIVWGDFVGNIQVWIPGTGDIPDWLTDEMLVGVIDLPILLAPGESLPTTLPTTPPTVPGINDINSAGGF